MLHVGSLCYYAKVDCHVSLEEKVTNHPKGSAVKDGIIFTLVLQFLLTKVKTRTLLAIMVVTPLVVHARAPSMLKNLRFTKNYCGR